MASDDIPGFDEDPELEELLSSDLEDLDEDTLQEVQLYKSQKLQAKRDADESTDRPEWWGQGAQAPETMGGLVEATGESAGGPSGSDDTEEDVSETAEADQEATSEQTEESQSDQEDKEEEQETEEEVTSDTKKDNETQKDDEKEPAPAGSSGDSESVGVDISDTDFEIDPEMEELLDEDVMDLDEEVRSDVQLYKSRKMQAKRDARQEAGGGQADSDDGAGTAAGSGDEDGLSKKAPPPTDTEQYKGERKIKDLVSSRKTGRQVTRRGFISSFGLGWLGTMAAFSTGAVGTLRFFFPNVLSNPPEKFIAGQPSDFPAGTVSAAFKDKYRVWISNLGDRLVAIQAVCTHLGCTPNWIDSQGIFKCPCHGSAYYQTGVNFAGPAPRPMDRVAIRLNPQGKIVVDKSKQFSSQASPGWESKDAYIPV